MKMRPKMILRTQFRSTGLATDLINTNRQTHRKTDRHTERQTDTDREKHTNTRRRIFFKTYLSRLTSFSMAP